MPTSRFTLAVLVAFAAPALRAQSAPTIQAESNGEVQLPTGATPSITVTTTCPHDADGSRCILWIEPVSETLTTERTLQWELTRASAGCAAAPLGAFRDVVNDPDVGVAHIAKGASCTLTFAFRIKQSGAPATADVVRNVSLYVTTP